MIEQELPLVERMEHMKKLEVKSQGSSHTHNTQHTTHNKVKRLISVVQAARTEKWKEQQQPVPR
jgi:hypothetical protein